MIIRNLLIAVFAFAGLLSSATAQIKAGKAIQLTISGVPQEEKVLIDGVYPVSDSGTVNMPHIKLVKASGKRPETFAALLEQKYKDAEIYTNPTIQVINSDGQKIDEELVIVGGFVRRPGPTPFFDKMTLWQAVQAAGGPTEFGSMNRVELTRGGGEPVKYDCSKPENQQLRLRPGDTINVPQKNWIGK